MNPRGGSLKKPIAECLAAFSLLCLLLPGVAASAPAVDLHSLTWYVHVDLIDEGAGEDLAYWQGVIDAAVASANDLLVGGQGPFDQPCCTRLGRSVSVTTFGSPGDGLDIIDSALEQETISNIGGPGSNAFLVDSMTHCSGPFPDAIGCAWNPGCDGNGNDDPDLWMVVTVESFDSETLGLVVAHERGHNACLSHVATAECQLMQGTIFTPGLAGCMTASECSHYQAGRTTTSSGLECGCYDNGGALVTDGTLCTEVSDGLCSGGLCGPYTGDAGVSLIAAAAPGTASGGMPVDALRISALSGEWTTLAEFSPAADEVRGIGYATDSSTLYGVVPTSGDDSIVTIDPVGGTLLSTVGTVSNGTAEIVSMAYDPGATSASGDDRLIVLEIAGSAGELRWIDPASPSTTNLLGSVDWENPQLFTGLAYDSLQRKLFAATSAGAKVYEIDLSSCSPSPCDSSQLPGLRRDRDGVSLSFSGRSGMLYMVGTVDFGFAQRNFYNVIDPTTGASVETLSLDIFSPAGLAAVPVPEPGIGIGFAVGLMTVVVVKRRRVEGFSVSGSGLRSPDAVETRIPRSWVSTMQRGISARARRLTQDSATLGADR